MVWRYNNPMRKNKLIIKLLLPLMALSLSACNASASRYSYNDRSSFSYRPTSTSSIENPDQYAKGKKVFDAFYDYPSYARNYGDGISNAYLSDFDLLLRPDGNGFFSVTLNIDNSDLYVDNIGSVYVADINFDGNKDLCVGKRVEEDNEHYTVYAYDIKNGKELLKLEEIDEANSINHDYTYNIRDDLLIVESSYNVNPISINSIGYFKTNTNKEANLDWQKIQFEIIDLEEEIKNIRTFKGSDGVERYIVNTEDTYQDLLIFINFIGDFSTSTYTEADVSFTASDDYDITVTNKFIDGLAFSIKFNQEGRFSIKCKIGEASVILRFEANNELYEMLQVA